MRRPEFLPAGPLICGDLQTMPVTENGRSEKTADASSSSVLFAAAAVPVGYPADRKDFFSAFRLPAFIPAFLSIMFLAVSVISKACGKKHKDAENG